MKKLMIFFVAGLAVACNAGQSETKEAAKETPAATPDYAYKIDNPDNWEIGSTANTATSLKALKAWELGNIDESLTYFADSVRVQFDGLDKKMPKDSLKAMLAGGRSNYKSMEVKMQDWESVIAKDKSEEWVTLWYKEYWETTAGLKDSVYHVNDLQFKDGKIIQLTEYTRKLH
jgi:hypothetical protein